MNDEGVRKEGEKEPDRVARLTYAELCDLTGLSRKLISEGLKCLVYIKVLRIIKEGNRNVYILINNRLKRGGWCKFPVRDLLSKDKKRIKALEEFNVRGKKFLHALKIFYYITAVRCNNSEFIEISYSKLSEKLNISNTDIKKAITILCSSDLIDHMDKKIMIVKKMSQINII